MKTRLNTSWFAGYTLWKWNALWPHWVCQRYNLFAFYSRLYFVCPRGQHRHVCSHPAANVEKNAKRTKSENETDKLSSATAIAQKDNFKEESRNVTYLKKNKPPEQAYQRSHWSLCLLQCFKDLNLPPNACFITKFMMMAFNSLPSLSDRYYIQGMRKSRILRCQIW